MPEAKAETYLWLRPERPRSGRQAPLSRAQIAQSAIALADEAGEEAVTMRKVAARLGCGTMSLYRHVRSRDELIDVMVDAVMGENPLDALPRGDWRATLRATAMQMRQQALRHPWITRVLPTRPFLGPNMLASVERILSAVDGLGLSTDEMVEVIRTVDAFVKGFTQNELAERKWRRPPEDLPPDSWNVGAVPYLRQVLATGQYPLVTRMILEAEDFPDPGREFEWQLDRVLDGLAAAIAAGPAAGHCCHPAPGLPAPGLPAARKPERRQPPAASLPARGTRGQ